MMGTVTMQLVYSEPYGPLVKSTVLAGDRRINVYHFDLPPDETGIFSVAQTLIDAPPVEEPAPREVEGPIELEPVRVEPVIIDKDKLDAAVAVAAKLNKLGEIAVEVEAPVSEGIER